LPDVDARAVPRRPAPAGSYRAPAWLPGGHAQTIWPYFLRRPHVAFRRELVITPDDDEWAFDWLDAQAPPDAPLVVLFHGLEGSSESHYARWLLHALAARRWRGVVTHFRGCAGTPNHTPRAYHSGDYEEVEGMLRAVRERADGVTRIFACGVSLGGSALLNWLGRRGTGATEMIAGAAAVCAPLDLMAAGHAIDRGANRIYARNFLRTLKPKALAMARRFPAVLDAQRIGSARSMWAFDDAVTARLHGFDGTEDYWKRASSRPWLRSVGVPTLVLNALNDPFVPASSLPGLDDVARAVTLEQPAGGGHMGFLTGPPPGRLDWLPRRLLAFFDDADAASVA
jgi:predicted alpha/beta-fold hydrolase